MKWLYCLILAAAWDITFSQDSILLRMHNPSVYKHLNPFCNPSINPDSNSAINPSLNWNINPIQTVSYNPNSNNNINPIINNIFNPQRNQILNPVFSKSLWPDAYAWNGRYIFDEHSNILGYISQASQDVMICFNNKMEWNGYFVKASDKLFNFFSITGVWTGNFLCTDNAGGYNFFSKDCKWMRQHIK